jgi:hypothetical protein
MRILWEKGVIKIKGKKVIVLLTSLVSGILFISIIACAKPQVIKPDVKGNAERAHEELKKEEKR